MHSSWVHGAGISAQNRDRFLGGHAAYLQQKLYLCMVQSLGHFCSSLEHLDTEVFVGLHGVQS